MKLVTVFASILLAIGLSGCGGGSSNPKTYDSAQSVANALGCTNYRGNAQEVGATDSATCDFGGDNVIVSWFKSDEVANSFKDLAQSAASVGGSDPILYGGNWAIECTAQPVCVKAKSKLGGDLK